MEGLGAAAVVVYKAFSFFVPSVYTRMTLQYTIQGPATLLDLFLIASM